MKRLFDPLYKPIVGREFPQGNEFARPDAKLVESVHDPIAIEADRLFSLEQTLAHDMGDGAIGGIIVVKPLAHGVEVLVTTSAYNAHAAMHRGRTQINEEAIPLEHAPGFVEGMNHALMGYSSQHPSEDHEVKGLVRII